MDQTINDAAGSYTCINTIHYFTFRDVGWYTVKWIILFRKKTEKSDWGDHFG